MPYIDEKIRTKLDNDIENIVTAIQSACEESYANFHTKDTNDYQVLMKLGMINYCFTKIIMKSIGNMTYSKIAMITGVLENVKQEFYRRAAHWYEDKKIVSNGDIKEYKHLH